MPNPDAVSAARRTSSSANDRVRVAFLGSEQWLDLCAPSVGPHGMHFERFAAGPDPDAQPLLAALKRFRPHVTVMFDPASVSPRAESAVTGATLGVLVDGGRDPLELAIGDLDRLVSFDPSLTGEEIGGHVVWRAMPPPVSDVYFADVRALHDTPRAMTLGASSDHREAMLMPAKHHHDVLQLIHGVWGDPLLEYLREYDVGIYVSARAGGGFGHEAAMHLAAGQLLLAAAGRPAFGLERNIDYLPIGSAEELVLVLERLGRFPEMHHRLRVRGRLKAEQFRASRIFGRVVDDLLRDLAVFGSARGAA